MKRALVASVLPLVLLVGCGSDDDKDAGSKDDGPGLAVSATPEQEEEARLLTKAELKKALLTLDDLPAGYAVSDDEDDDEDDDDDCGSAIDDVKPDIEAEASFEKGEGFGIEIAFISIGQYQDADAAEKIFDQVEEALADCDPTTDDSGNTMTYKKLSTDDIGDGTFAFKGTGSQGGAAAFQAVLSGPRIIITGSAGFLSMDVDLMTELAEDQLERLEDAG